MKIGTFERLWIATGKSTRFTTTMQCLSTRQSGELIRGRRNIQASRSAQPNRRRFMVRRVLGPADLWVTELVLTSGGLPS
jgi:hypothetical protein